MSVFGRLIRASNDARYTSIKTMTIWWEPVFRYAVAFACFGILGTLLTVPFFLWRNRFELTSHAGHNDGRRSVVGSLGEWLLVCVIIFSALAFVVEFVRPLYGKFPRNYPYFSTLDLTEDVYEAEVENARIYWRLYIGGLTAFLWISSAACLFVIKRRQRRPHHS